MIKEMYEKYLLSAKTSHSSETIKTFLANLYISEAVTLTENDLCSLYTLINEQGLSDSLIDFLDTQLCSSDPVPCYAKDLNIPFVKTISGNSFYYVEQGHIFSRSNRLMAWSFTPDGLPLWDSVGRTQDETRLVPTFMLKDSFVTYEYDDEICNLSRIWGYNLYEFFIYSFVYVLAMEKDGYTGRYMLPQSAFASELMELAHVSQDRIIWLSNDDGRKHFIAKKLIIPEYSRDYLLNIAITWGNNLCDNTVHSPSEYPERLYIERTDGRILNGANDIITEYGFHYLRPETIPVLESILYFRNAKIIIAPHGAANTRFLFCKEGTCIIETFPNTWISSAYVELVRLKKLKYQMVAEERFEGWNDYSAANAQWANYTLNGDTLRCAIENAIDMIKQ